MAAIRPLKKLGISHVRGWRVLHQAEGVGKLMARWAAGARVREPFSAGEASAHGLLHAVAGTADAASPSIVSCSVGAAGSLRERFAARSPGQAHWVQAARSRLSSPWTP